MPTNKSASAKVGRNEVADVLIIGAGPSGSVAAKHLAQAGIKVVCLEQGHMPDASKFAGRGPEWELTSQKQWHPNPNYRDLERDYPINTDESAVHPLMFSGVGGSATLYAGHWTPFMPSDFRVRSLDGIADDWPFSYEELTPFLEEIEREVGVSGLGGDPAYPPKMAYPTPALPIGKVGSKAAECMDAMGWHWWPGANAIPSLPYNGLNACVRRGTCAQQARRVARLLHEDAADFQRCRMGDPRMGRRQDLCGRAVARHRGQRAP